MKTLLKYFIIGLVGSCSLVAYKATAVLEIGASFQIDAQADFYVPLASDGAWIEVDNYGRCWHPSHVSVDWRPYCDGYWVWTDCGWYWVSDEPWAWACYHYGRWIYEDRVGWAWVPGVEWAPAWVSWRVGGGYVGWAPMTPVGFRASVAFGVPAPFVFVSMNHFDQRVRPSTVIVNNTKIINQTKVVEGSRRESRSFNGGASQKVIINEGPGLSEIQKFNSKPIRSVSIHEVVAKTHVPASAQRHHVENAPARTVVEEHNVRSTESHEPLVHEPVRPVNPHRDQPESPRELVPAPRPPVDVPKAVPEPLQPPHEHGPGRGHDHGHGRD